MDVIWWYVSLWILQTHVLLSINSAARLEISTVYGLKHKNNKKKNPVYKNTAAIKHLLIYYKGLSKYIKNYIDLAAPFLRKVILPSVQKDKDVLDRDFCNQKFNNSSSRAEKKALPLSHTQTEVANYLTNGFYLTNDTIQKLLQYNSSATPAFCASFLFLLPLFLCSTIQVSILHCSKISTLL